MASKRPTFPLIAVCMSFTIAGYILYIIMMGTPSHKHITSLFSSPTSRAPAPPRLLFITPRSDGFCNQLITIYESLHCARRLNRTAVLPHMYENVRYDTWPLGPYAHEDYFDPAPMRSYVDAVTVTQLARLAPVCRTVYVSNPERCEHPRAQGCAPIPPLYRDLYNSRLRIRPRPAPAYPQSAPCVDDAFCNDARHLGPYSRYDTGQGFNIATSDAFREIRALLKPSKLVQQLAEHFLRHIPPRFNAVHLRRGDYSEKCAEMPRECFKYGPSSFVQDRHAVLRALNTLNSPHLPLFVSTTHERQVRDMLRGVNVTLYFLGNIPLPWSMFAKWHRVDIIAFASQIVASHAERFVGNRFSSYSTEINNWRYLAGKTEKRHFF